MKNTIFVIIKKELARFFGDKRTAFSTILLPGLMIFLLYNFMGSALSEQYTVDEDYKTICYTSNLPESFEASLEEMNFSLKKISAEDKLENAKKAITNKKADLLLAFPADFEQRIVTYKTTSKEAAPEIGIYYNSSETTSYEAYNKMVQFLDAYESSITNRFDINASETEFDLATKEDSSANFVSSMLPMLLLIFLFSGTISIAPESIAGEKERGTIATLLVTPVKRGGIAIGKILSLSLIAILSGISSTVGTIASLPKLMSASQDGFSGNIYSVIDYLILAAIIISTVLVMVAMVSLLSAFAKSIKEAQTMSTPLVVVITLIGVTAMFGNNAKEDLLYYLIPLYNSVQCMISIFKFNINSLHIVVTVISNLLYALAGVFALTKMFKSERIIFTK